MKNKDYEQKVKKRLRNNQKAFDVKKRAIERDEQILQRLKDKCFSEETEEMPLNNKKEEKKIENEEKDVIDEIFGE